MPAAPPTRRIPVNVIGATTVPDPTTERAMGELRDQVDRLRRQVAALQAAEDTTTGSTTVTSDIYGDQQRLISLKDFSVTSGSTGGSHNGYSIIEAGSINTQFIFGPLPLRVGERLKAFRIRTNKNSTGTMTVQFSTSSDGSGVSGTGTSATSSTSGLQTIAATLASPVTTLQDTLYFLGVFCPNVSDRIHAMSFTVDKVV